MSAWSTGSDHDGRRSTRSRPIDAIDLAALACRDGEGFTGWVAVHGEPLLINDAGRDPRGRTTVGAPATDLADANESTGP